MLELFSPSHEWKRNGANFAATVLNPLYKQAVCDDRSFHCLWKACSDFGLTGLMMPGEYGGTQQELLDVIKMMEGIGSTSTEVGIMFAVNAHIWACEMPILKFGTEQQKARYLPPMIKGDIIGAHAISEEEAGSDIWNLRTTYQVEEGGFRLNGIKNYVTNAPFANIFLVFAREERSSQMKGISCFIVARNTEDFSVGRPIEKMGLEFSPFASIYLNNCFIPQENLLGKIDQGTFVFNYAMEYERPFLLSFQVGVMEKQLKDCVRYAKERVQFQQSIIQFQSVSNKIADMKSRLEASRLLLYKVALLKQQGKNTYLDSSIAKLFISESLVANSLQAMEIFGTHGYLKECDVEKQLRDSLAGKFYSGTSDIHRNIISGMI